jgi:hypothetical protein
MYVPMGQLLTQLAVVTSRIRVSLNTLQEVHFDGWLVSQVAQPSEQWTWWVHSQSPPWHSAGVIHPSSHTQTPSWQLP